MYFMGTELQNVKNVYLMDLFSFDVLIENLKTKKIQRD